MDAYLVIVIVLGLVFLVLAVGWVPVLRSPPPAEPSLEWSRAGYGTRCSLPGRSPSGAGYQPQPCDRNLTCVADGSELDYGYCRRAMGAPCTTLYECDLNATECRGICTGPPVVGLDSVCAAGGATCDRNLGLVCGTEGRCKIGLGNAGCTLNEDCAIGNCQTHPGGVRYCAAVYPDGAACASDLDCEGATCQPTSIGGGTGYCQSTGVITGSEGAACVVNQTAGGAPCGAKLVCASLSTSASGYGVCAIEKAPGDYSACSRDSGCIPPSICIDGNCSLPVPTNSCAANTTGICSSGYSCVDGLCIAASTNSQVPVAPTGTTVRSLVEWSPATRSWSNHLRHLTPEPDPTEITALDDGKRLLLLYRSGDNFYLVPPAGNPIQLQIPIPPNSSAVYPTAVITPTVNKVRFTVGGRVIILASWSNPAYDPVFCVYIQSVPVSWWQGLAIPPLEYRVNVTIDPSSQPVYIYPVGFGGKVIDFDVDDRPDGNGNIRLLYSMIPNDGFNTPQRYATVTTFAQLNQNTFPVNSIQTGINSQERVRLYSVGKLVTTPSTYFYSDSGGPIQVTVNNLPIDRYPSTTGTVEAWSVYAPVALGYTRSSLLYLVTTSTGTELHLFNQVDQRLPGYFSSTDLPIITFPVASLDAIAYTPRYLVLASTY